jgi:hypothetical protein
MPPSRAEVTVRKVRPVVAGGGTRAVAVETPLADDADTEAGCVAIAVTRTAATEKKRIMRRTRFSKSELNGRTVNEKFSTSAPNAVFPRRKWSPMRGRRRDR